MAQFWQWWHLKASKFWSSYRDERRFRRHAHIFVGFFVASLGEIALLVLDLRQHAQGVLHKFVLHPLITIGLVLLPFMMWALIVRLPFARRWFKTRYTIRPFATLSTKPTLEGGAIAALFYRELLNWQSKAAAGAVEDRISGPSSQSPTITLGHASLPLSWLWTKLYFPLVGKENVIVGGVLFEAEQPFRLRVWTSADPNWWEVTLDPKLSTPAALDAAIRRIVPRVLECLDPLQAALIYSFRSDFDDAIRLHSKDASSLREKIDLVQALISGGALKKAERILAHLHARKRERQREIDRMRGSLQLHQGKFAEARVSLKNAISPPNPKTRKRGSTDSSELPPRKRKRNERTDYLELAWIAQSWAYEGNYHSALQIYEDADKSTRAELARLAGETVSPDLHEISFANFSEERAYQVRDVLIHLATIAKQQSICNQRLNRFPEALNALDVSRRVLWVIFDLALYDSWDQSEEGQITEMMARLRNRVPQPAASSPGAVPPPTFDSDIEQAIDYYKAAINTCETIANTRDDTSMLLERAWAHLGRGSALLCRIEHTGLSLSDIRLTRIRLLYQIADELLEPARSVFIEHFNRASQLVPNNPADSDKHVWHAELQFRDGLNQEPFLKSLHSKADQDEGDIQKELGANHVLVPELSPETHENAQKLGMLTSDLVQIQRWAHGLLVSLVREPNEVIGEAVVAEVDNSPANDRVFTTVDGVGGNDHLAVVEESSDNLDSGKPDKKNLWDCANDLNEMNKSLNTCLRIFDDLCASPQQSARSEGWYGKACVSAIERDASAAARCLSQTRLQSVDQTAYYLNRAVMNPDFDNIRISPEFRALWRDIAPLIAADDDVRAEESVAE